ncbi:ATP-binding cassette domain-containing protein [Pedobacter sp. HMF7647]|uniref:ATP-binding cassette domain-containing protein n=1 Tax=Hufsiella arboris TaxID=2695275 RepID=A0A7K1YFD0_9SPHI|nr:ATP-binding cassette domain-containing protein [Hufsiella arboris]MXV53305.1 ATP-binding cassette domain-containing protein [Hufsiella arboris]
MIRLENVSKTFGSDTVVKNISLEIAEGETMVLLGTSGCGKTTTLRMINRLIEASSGQIFIHGQNILDQNPEILRRGIGYVLQNTGLFPHYTVAENIAIVPKLLGWDSEKINKRSGELLEKLHLKPGEFLNKYPSELSGGQQQRIGLARALAADPPVLLMDEPFGALDPITRNKIQKDFKDLDELKNKTIVMVTHDVYEAFELADKICLMDKGEIKQQGAPEEFLSNPASHFVSSFLKEQRLQLELQNTMLSAIDPGVMSSDSNLNVWEALNISLKKGHKPEESADFETAELIKNFIRHKTGNNG